MQSRKTFIKELIMFGYGALAFVNIIFAFYFVQLHSIIFIGFALYLAIVLTYIKSINTFPTVEIDNTRYFVYQHYLNLTDINSHKMRNCIFLLSAILFITSYIISFLFMNKISQLESTLYIFNLFIMGFASLIPIYDDILISFIQCNNVTILEIPVTNENTYYGTTTFD